MSQINYKYTVNIEDKRMSLGFLGKMTDEMQGHSVRVQAIFSQRSVERRFPMTVSYEEDETGCWMKADAEIELPYVFYRSPKKRVMVTFSVWCAGREYLLDSQPFPVEKDMFVRVDKLYKRNVVKFALCTAGLPVSLLKNYTACGKNKTASLKAVNEAVYKKSGYSYSKRQNNTDYFSEQYKKYVRKHKKLSGNTVLFLSERLPEQGGNLMRIKACFGSDPAVHVTEFIRTKTVSALSKKELRECAEKCAKADVIILEDFYPQLHSLSIRHETKVVQLWHACGAFKTFGLTRMGKRGGAPQSSMNHRNYDLVAVSSQAICPIYAEAFGISSYKVKALGVPRTDALMDASYKENTRKKLYEKYPMLKDKRVILFAPTFRGDGNKDAYYPEDAFCVNAFMESMPEDTFCIVKHHPFVVSKLSVAPEFADRVLDLTGKDHINDLMLLTDLLITDYSSSVFEAAILSVPMLFYAFDVEQYMKDRDFYMPYKEFVPGPIAYTWEELLEETRRHLAGENNTSYRQAWFHYTFLSALDGKSTQRIYEYIREKFLHLP